MPLKARCHHCDLVFPVFAQDLRRHRGPSPCPHCHAHIDVIAALLDEPLSGESAATSAPLDPSQPEFPAAPPAIGGDDATPAGPDPLASPPPLKSHRGRLLWGLAALVLVSALGLQTAWWNRADLLRDPQVHRALDALCRPLGCLVPALRIPGTLSVLEPTLTPDAETGVLCLRLRMHNRATLDQPVPHLELELFDQQGDLTAARRFTPAEYAPDLGDLLAAQGKVDVQVSIDRPQAETSGFKVRLL